MTKRLPDRRYKEPSFGLVGAIQDRNEAARKERIARAKRYCDVCSRDYPHIHCPECGDTSHVASECDMEG